MDPVTRVDADMVNTFVLYEFWHAAGARLRAS
jgi:hypothetical protein